MLIRQYIYKNRNGKRAKVGLLVGTTIRDRIVIGFSLCCAEDVFDKDKALAIAIGRALSPKSQECPPSILGEASAFAARCQRYFKDAHLNYGD